MNLKTLALVCTLASVTTQIPVRAADAPPAAPQPEGPRRGGGGPGFRQPGFQDLSKEEQDKMKAARETAMKDPKVKAAMEKADAARKELGEAMNAAIVAADPSLEPVVKKLQEAGEKARADRANRPPGDAPKPPQ